MVQQIQQHYLLYSNQIGYLQVKSMRIPCNRPLFFTSLYSYRNVPKNVRQYIKIKQQCHV